MTSLSRSSAVVNAALDGTPFIRVGDWGEVSSVAGSTAGLGGDVGLVWIGEVAACMTGDMTGLHHAAVKNNGMSQKQTYRGSNTICSSSSSSTWLASSR